MFAAERFQSPVSLAFAGSNSRSRPTVAWPLPTDQASRTPVPSACRRLLGGVWIYGPHVSQAINVFRSYDFLLKGKPTALMNVPDLPPLGGHGKQLIRLRER